MIVKLLKRAGVFLALLALCGVNAMAEGDIGSMPVTIVTGEEPANDGADTNSPAQSGTQTGESQTREQEQSKAQRSAANPDGEASDQADAADAAENAGIMTLDAGDDALSVTQRNSREYVMSVQGSAVPDGAKAVRMAVWSKLNGQDDIRWYEAGRQANGTYAAVFSLLNHKGLGEYSIHAYAVMNNDQHVYIDGEKIVINTPGIENLEITNYDADRGTFRVVLSGVTNDDLIREVLVPVWSKVDGQDDICWYGTKKSSNGDYYVDIDIRNHKYSVGTYYVHSYVVDVTGCQYFTGSKTLDIARESGELTVTKNSDKDYTITLKGLRLPGGEKEVQFPVWSKVNGQDDIIWHAAVKGSDQVYRCKVSVTDHKGLGEFAVHAYARMQDGALVFLGSTKFETEAPSVESVQAAVTNKSAGQFQVKVSGIKNGGLIKQIQVPVWSESNQGDIVWYPAARDANGDYIVNVNIANHKYRGGVYQAHAYMTDITGALQFVGATSCEMKTGYDSLSAADISGTESTYRITLSGLAVPSGEKGVRFAVWGAENGQNDIRWYTAARQSNGSYIYDVMVANHKEFGKYCVHAYYETREGSLQVLGATGFEVTKRPMAAQVQASDINQTAGTFRITVTGVTSVSGVEKVEIPVWCAADQSDIAWYNAARVSEGVYAVNVRVAQHAHHFGDYKAHVYVTARNGGKACVGGTTVNITPVNYVYTLPISATQQEVGIMGVSGSRVQFPTWSNEFGQDDIVWYEGTNRGGGKWNAVVDSARHNSGGAYTTHVYISSGNSMSGFGMTSYSLYKVPTEQGQMQIRANMYGSPTPYLLMVNRSTHKVGVFQGSQGSWNCIQYWDCGDGAPGTPTVEGTFSVGNRGYYFDSGSARCYWYTQFYGNYLFHSVLYHKNGTLMDGRVGMPLSHGCVRLLIENAKWIYDTIPSGTTVVVYH